MFITINKTKINVFLLFIVHITIWPNTKLSQRGVLLQHNQSNVNSLINLILNHLLISKASLFARLLTSRLRDCSQRTRWAYVCWAPCWSWTAGCTPIYRACAIPALLWTSRIGGHGHDIPSFAAYVWHPLSNRLLGRRNHTSDTPW